MWEFTVSLLLWQKTKHLNVLLLKAPFNELLFIMIILFHIDVSARWLKAHLSLSVLTSCCCDQLTRSSASSHDIRFPCSHSTDSAELGTEPTPATLTLETLVWLFFKTCFRRNIWRLMRNVRSPNSAEKHSRLMSPSCVSCGLGAIWWLLDKFKSRWISCCMLLSLYAEWTTGFYRFSDVWSLSLTRYVNQIRADEVSNWVFSRWNFAACIFTQRTSQNESCLKVKVSMDRVFKKKTS